MKGLRKLLIEEYLRLEKIAGKLRKELADMPEGTLRVSKSHNYTQFYNVKKENDMKCQKFLQKSEMDLWRNQRIIAGNAQFTGIAAGRGVGFTTGLLLLREGLGMRETPIRPHSWH